MSEASTSNFKRQRVAQIVVGQRIANLDRQSVWLLAGRTTRTPNAQRPIAPLLLALQNFFQDDFLEEFELRLDAEEARFIHRQVFEQRNELLFAFPARQQPVVAVEGVHLARLQAALQTVAQEMSAALIEVHAALLVNERLQELQFGFGKWDLRRQCGHSSSLLLLSGSV
jgi:hypothetical protein